MVISGRCDNADGLVVEAPHIGYASVIAEPRNGYVATLCGKERRNHADACIKRLSKLAQIKSTVTKPETTHLGSIKLGVI